MTKLEQLIASYEAFIRYFLLLNNDNDNHNDNDNIDNNTIRKKKGIIFLESFPGTNLNHMETFKKMIEAKRKLAIHYDIPIISYLEQVYPNFLDTCINIL